MRDYKYRLLQVIANYEVASNIPDAEIYLRINPCIIKGCEVTRSEIVTNLRPNIIKREYTRGRAHLIISELGYLTTNPLGPVKPTDCFIRYNGLIGTRGLLFKSKDYFDETIPRKEYNIRVSFSTFLKDLIWSMYLHRKSLKFGTFREDV